MPRYEVWESNYECIDPDSPTRVIEARSTDGAALKFVEESDHIENSPVEVIVHEVGSATWHELQLAREEWCVVSYHIRTLEDVAGPENER